MSEETRIDEVFEEYNEEETETIEETQEVEETPNHETETEVEENTEKDTPNDTKPKEEVSEEEKQKRAYYAEKKRQEKAEKEVKQAIKTNSEINLTGKQPKTNPFTNLPIEDEEDRKDYLEMLEAKSKGYDPTSISQMAMFHKEKRTELRKQAEEEKAKKEQADQETRKWFIEDKKAFETKYPDVNIQDLTKNKNFVIIAKGRAGKESLVTIYEDYLELENSYNSKKEEAKIEAIARAKSNPGSLSGNKQDLPNEKLDYNKWIKDAMSGRLD